MKPTFGSFKEFYPYYLSQHQNPLCKKLHLIGSYLVLFGLIFSFWTKYWTVLFSLPLVGYGFAWVGHFFFEKNRPATFQYPFYSLMGDWKMWWDEFKKEP